MLRCTSCAKIYVSSSAGSREDGANSMGHLRRVLCHIWTQLAAVLDIAVFVAWLGAGSALRCCMLLSDLAPRDVACFVSRLLPFGT